MSDQIIQNLVTVCGKLAFEGDWTLPLMEAVGEIRASDAQFKASQEERSVWEIVTHVIAWTDWVNTWLDGQDTDVVDWPPVLETDEAAWKETQEQLRRTLTTFQTQIAKTLPDDLFGMPTPEVTTTTRFLGISSILVHLAYHAGQITVLAARFAQNG